MASAVNASTLAFVPSSRQAVNRSRSSTRVVKPLARAEILGSKVHQQGALCYIGAMPTQKAKVRVVPPQIAVKIHQLDTFREFDSERITDPPLFPCANLQTKTRRNSNQTKRITEMCSILACYDPNGTTRCPQ